MTQLCIACGEELEPERAELGYTYCTRPACQARHHRGVAVTAVAVNKSGDAFRVVDPEEAASRAAAGEFGAKNSTLGLDHRQDAPPVTPAQRTPAQRTPARRTPRTPIRRAPARRPAPAPWSPAQENLVRLYADMGLRPREIAERARTNTPRLGITESLAARILASPRRR